MSTGFSIFIELNRCYSGFSALSECGSFTKPREHMRTHRSDDIVLSVLEGVLSELQACRQDIAQLRNELSMDKDQIMSELTDLQTAMGALVTEAVTDLEAVIAKLASAPPSDAAALVALTQQANDTIAKLKADMAPLITPAPTPAPAPTTTTAAPAASAAGTQNPPST